MIRSGPGNRTKTDELGFAPLLDLATRKIFFKWQYEWLYLNDPPVESC
jgi:hypothetical protein